MTSRIVMHRDSCLHWRIPERKHAQNNLGPRRKTVAPWSCTQEACTNRLPVNGRMVHKAGRQAAPLFEQGSAAEDNLDRRPAGGRGRRPCQRRQGASLRALCPTLGGANPGTSTPPAQLGAASARHTSLASEGMENADLETPAVVVASRYTMAARCLVVT